MYRYILLFLICCNSSFGQFDNQILFKVNDSVIFVEEFHRVYNKNIELINDVNQKDFDSYFDLFINYKLKLAEAYEQNLHTDPKYKSELNKYAKQLQNTYLTDKETEDMFLKEAYERTKLEVNVSHVLIRLDENNNDSIDSYDKLNSLRESFKNISLNDFNEKYNVNQNMIVENLGYFSAFKMIYEFENIAYSTTVGEVSIPFRTRFGLHILKVNDKRKSLGEVTVGHIMKYKNKSDAFQAIKNISDSINNGKSFEYLAKKYSEDKNSSFKGGRLNSFSSGQINSIPFEDAAFSLVSTGDVSKPVETKYGWHLIKLYSKKNIKTFDELKYQLLNKLKKSSRFNIISDSFYSFLLDKYKITYNNENLEYFISILNSDYFQNKWSIPEDINEEQVLVKILNTEFTYLDFATFIDDNQKKSRIEDYPSLIRDLYKKFIDYNVLEIYKNNLETENLDYRFVIKEYREGLLLFNLMQDKIWTLRDSDSINLKNFYNKNKSNYKSFQEDRGQIIGDFQDFQESEWIETLKSKHKVTLNKKAIKKLKKQYD